MNSESVYERYGQEAYFFVLKRVNNTSIAHDVFQGVFLKVHQNIDQLVAVEKARAWVLQICRNEIANYFNKESAYHSTSALGFFGADEAHEDFCCFDRFIDELPETYRQVIELTYIAGKKQEETADLLGISLANVKARVRRAKAYLKKRFLKCCKYEVNSKGDLIGTPNCSLCN